jgi:predicted DNA-binding transcriptional regulator YafY
MEKLIRQKRTGTPAEFAKRLSVTRGTLYNIIDELSSHDVKIKYCRTDRTFHYNCDHVIEISFGVKTLNNHEEMRNISGGSKLFSFRPIF